MEQHHPLSRYFLSKIQLSSLTPTEVEETILKTLSRAGVLFADEIVSRVYEYTEGHPFEMQVLCYHLFRNQLERRVDVDMWEKALQSALETMGDAIFNSWYSQASIEETKVLNVVAKTDTPIAVKEVAGRVSTSSTNVTKYLQRLTDKQLIAKSSRGLYIVSDRMFRAYIQARSAQ